MRTFPILALLLSAGLGLAGCDPTCRATCRKLISCDDDVDMGSMTIDDCQDYCESQEQLYEDEWDDLDLQEGWSELKRCIRSEECADIGDGVCYDEDLYLW